MWGLLVDIDRWTERSPCIRVVSLDGPLARVARPRFTLRLLRVPLHSRIRMLEPGRRIARTRTLVGSETVHGYRPETLGERTLVGSEASWNGRLVRLPVPLLRAVLCWTSATVLRQLQREAERRSA